MPLDDQQTGNPEQAAAQSLETEAHLGFVAAILQGGKAKWMFGILAILALSLLVYWLMPIAHKNNKNICLRPTIWLDIMPSEDMDMGHIHPLMSQIIYSYPAFNLLPAKDICGQAPRLSLRLEAQKKKYGIYLDATLAPMDIGAADLKDEDILWHKSYPLGGGVAMDTLEISLMDMMYNIGYYKNETVEKVAHLQWADKQAQANFICSFYLLGDSNSLKKELLSQRVQCLTKQMKEKTPFADVYSQYALFSYLRDLDILDFDSGSYGYDMNFAVEKAKEIDPNNMNLLRLYLFQERNNKNVDHAKLAHIMNVIEDYHLFAPDMLSEHAKLNALYFGKYDQGYLYALKASKILADDSFNYVFLIKRIMTHDWEAANNYMHSHALVKYPSSGLFALLVGGKTQDQELIEFGLNALHSYGYDSKEKTLTYLKKLEYHHSLSNRLRYGVKQYYRAPSS